MNSAEHESAHQAFRRAVEIAGSQAALQRKTGLLQQTTSASLKHKRLCPPEHVLAIEAATGISKHELRPDIYPLPDAAPAPAAEPSDRYNGARA